MRKIHQDVPVPRALLPRWVHKALCRNTPNLLVLRLMQAALSSFKIVRFAMVKTPEGVRVAPT